MAATFATDLDLVVRYPAPCPHCGEKPLEPIRDLATKDEIACAFCGGTIDCKGAEWRSGVKEIQRALSEITVES